MPPGTSIRVTLAEVLEDRGVTLVELSKRTGVSTVNLSLLKNNHAKAVRFTTLEAICDALACSPGDLLTRMAAHEHEAGDPRKRHRGSQGDEA
ncbi:helix-turn-helix transcriptional regulator [uncultured Microbacterium sp.]|uniref:helix-turn-helix domain-containing protein n=1 Tax=uncultured Microbacterium sp. TaxID=191216 RepID=UPI0028EDCE36|nr:helix-turn-helix transcriptional regulator [uncultured Microbacterium sp.]